MNFLNHIYTRIVQQIESSEAWEQTTMFLKRSGYQIKVSRTDHVVIEEKYSPDLYVCLHRLLILFFIDRDCKVVVSFV